MSLNCPKCHGEGVLISREIESGNIKGYQMKPFKKKESDYIDSNQYFNFLIFYAVFGIFSVFYGFILTHLFRDFLKLEPPTIRSLLDLFLISIIIVCVLMIFHRYKSKREKSRIQREFIRYQQILFCSRCSLLFDYQNHAQEANQKGFNKMIKINPFK